MNNSISDTFCDFALELLSLAGIYKHPSPAEVKHNLSSQIHIPKWASNTLISILWNIDENDCKKIYPSVKRRLPRWNKIRGDEWTALEKKLTLLFLKLSKNNLVQLSSIRQRELPWIKAVLDSATKVSAYLEANDRSNAQNEAKLLVGFTADHAKLMNFTLAEATERLAAATVAASQLDGGVSEVAINAIPEGPFIFRDHPLDWMISYLDDKSRH